MQYYNFNYKLNIYPLLEVLNHLKIFKIIIYIDIIDIRIMI